MSKVNQMQDDQFIRAMIELVEAGKIGERLSPTKIVVSAGQAEVVRRMMEAGGKLSKEIHEPEEARTDTDTKKPRKRASD